MTKHQLPDSDFFSNAGTRMRSAKTLDQLRFRILERYERHVKNRMYHQQERNQQEILTGGKKFQQDNLGYPVDWAPTLNDWGMRQPHTVLDQVDTCFYGCSITYGSGISDEVLWARQLSQRMGWSYNNFGFSAISHDECVDLFMVTSRMIKMKSAVFLLPDYTRIMQCFRKKGIESVYHYVSIVPGGGEATDGAANEFYREYTMLPRLYLYEKMARNLEIIKYVAQQHGIKVYISSWCELGPVFDALNDQNDYIHVQVPATDQKGRDGKHPGCEWHTQVADQFENTIKSNQ